MINRLQHFINGVEFVPTNKDTFSLSASFTDEIGEWENDFNGENNVVLPNEAYIELRRHLDEEGFQQMPEYNLRINGQNNAYFVDLNSNVAIRGSDASVSIKKFYDKENIQSLIEDTTFEFLKQSGKITDSDMVNIPYVVIPDDMGSRILNISTMLFAVGEKIINTTQLLVERVGDLLNGTIPNTGVGVTWPVGAAVRYGILIAMDVAKLILLNILFVRLAKQGFELSQPPVRNFKAMTVDRLLTIALAEHNIVYESSLKSEFKRVTVLPIPIDFQQKKLFELLLNEDHRVLNRGYPTASDTVSNADLLIKEISKIYNIQPSISNGVLNLEPKATKSKIPTVTLDRNFNDQATKENKGGIDASQVWNTKIISYTNDINDRLLFDNPRGLRTEYKTVVKDGVTNNDLTIIKGSKDIRINFALGTIKEDTKLDEFLEKLAKISDKALNTSFTSKLNKRKGVLALSQEQFSVTKLLYQIGGKQTKDYLKHIGSDYIYKTYHSIDESRNSLYEVFLEMPVRMNNEQFKGIIQNKLVNLEGEEVEITDVSSYLAETSTATVNYRVKNLEWTKNLKTIKVYEE